MNDKDCAPYLTHDIVTEAFRKKHEAFSGNEKDRSKALYTIVTGCIYTSYHDVFITRSVIHYKIYFRENRLEETGEESFAKAMETFETYVRVAGLEKKRPVKVIFYGFYRRIFLNQLRNVKPVDEYGEGTGDDNDDAEMAGEEGKGLDKEIQELFTDIGYDWNKEINLRCLEQYLAQENNRDVKVIKWRHFERLSSWELAEKLGITSHAASVLVDRCMKRLRAYMETCNKKQDEN